MRSPPLNSVTFVGMFQTSQCVNVPFGASGSVTSSAMLCAVCGTFAKSSGGIAPAPLQVYWGGILAPFAKAGLVIAIAPVAGGGSEGLPGGGTFLLGFMQPSANARVRITAIRVLRIAPPMRSYNRSMPTFFDALNELMAAETPLVAVTVVDTMGSAPQDRGAKMIVTAEGLRFGTVGGGKVETKAIAEAQQ